MKAVRRPQFWFKLTMWLLSFVIAGLLIQLGGRIMQDIPTAGERISRDDFVNAEQLNKVDAQLEELEKAIKVNLKPRWIIARIVDFVFMTNAPIAARAKTHSFHFAALAAPRQILMRQKQRRRSGFAIASRVKAG